MRPILLVHDLARLLEVLELLLGNVLRLLRFQQSLQSAHPCGLPQGGPLVPQVLEIPPAHRLAQPAPKGFNRVEIGIQSGSRSSLWFLLLPLVLASRLPRPLRRLPGVVGVVEGGLVSCLAAAVGMGLQGHPPVGAADLPVWRVPLQGQRDAVSCSEGAKEADQGALCQVDGGGHDAKYTPKVQCPSPAPANEPGAKMATRHVTMNQTKL